MSLQRARRSVKLYLDRLRSQVNILLGQQYPGDHPGPKLWLSLIVGVLDTADEYIAATTIAGTDPTEAQDRVSDSAELARLAYKSLQFIIGAGIEDLPYPIIQPLQRWFDRFGVKNTTFFHVEHRPIYELFTKDSDEFVRIRNQSPRLQSAIKKITWPLLRITVPSKELGILPYYSIVAHELGHAIYSSIPLDFSRYSGKEDLVTANIYKEISGIHIDPSGFQKEFTASWIKELAADAVAFYITGPALFFALSEFFQHADGSYGLCDTHPPFDLRRRMLYSKLREGGDSSYASVLQKSGGVTLTEDFNSILLVTRPSKEAIYKDMKSFYNHEKACVLKELSEYIEEIAPSIYEQIETYLKENYPDQLYSPRQLEEDLNNHLEPMLAAIPPIEKGIALDKRTPTEFATILNVGWTVLLTKLDELRVRVEDPDTFGSQKAESLHSLLLKAVELSETRRLWDACK